MLTIPALDHIAGLRHGFFTREGGVSEGIYGSLNCGFGSGDDPDHVAENRCRAMARFGLSSDALCTVHQHHSADCVAVKRPWSRSESPKADAMATDRSGVALGILTADCTPVLFADSDAGVIGAAHAGWRGALGGVLDATVATMTALGASAANMVAAVGPCIGPASYEVGPEFRDAFLAGDGGNETFFAPSKRDGHFMFDLPGYVAGRLATLGIGAIAPLDLDTRGDEARFYSYRRACQTGEKDYGRLLSAIALEA